MLLLLLDGLLFVGLSVGRLEGFGVGLGVGLDDSRNAGSWIFRSVG